MKRDHAIDFVKGFAVIAMSFVHVSIFFNVGESIFLDSITKWGAISCFSAFLLLSGMLGGMGMRKGGKPNWSKTLKKLSFLYVSYLLIALFSWYVNQGQLSLKNVLNIIILKELPLLSEYLVTFMLLFIFYQVAYKLLYKISKSWALVLLLSIGIFLLGQLLYSMNVLDGVWIKGLFVGDGSYHYFPLLQYLPIYLLGLFLGRQSEKKYYFIAFFLILLSYILLKVFNLANWNRFPPSSYFLIESLIIPAFILAILKGFKLDLKFLFIEIFAKESLLSLLVLTLITLVLARILPREVTTASVWLINISVLVLTGGILTLYFKGKKMV